MLKGPHPANRAFSNRKRFASVGTKTWWGKMKGPQMGVGLGVLHVGGLLLI